METLDGDTGAVVGAHIVTIATYQGEVQDDYSVKTVRRKEIPMKYREPGALTFDVPTEGTTSANFELN